MEIDLGGKKKANVTYDGKKYQMDVPNLKQIEDFLAEMKNQKGSEHKAFKSFVVTLGLPKEVSNSLDIEQYRMLSDGLMGGLEKK